MTPTAFLFGKLPAHGDFVARGLDPAQRAAWDGWGADLLATLKAQAADAFDHAHISAPPWRFLVRGSGDWTVGAVAPSVDGVGRRFLLAMGACGLSDAVAGAAGLGFAEAAEGLVYEALADRLDADALLARADARFGDIVVSSGAAAIALGARPQVTGLWWTLGSAQFGGAAIVGREPPGDLFARTVAAASPRLEPVL